MTLFKDARSKVERAEHHIGNVEKSIRAFAASDYYAIRAEHDPKTRQNSLRFDITNSLPESTALIIGDAIHNLRSALDFVTSDIVFHLTGERVNYTKFPIYKTREELVGALKNGKIQPASSKVSDHILSIVKPYEAGNHLIWSLHRLDIEDKHRLLIAFVEVTAVNRVHAKGEGSRPFEIHGTWVFSNSKGGWDPFFQTDGDIHIYDYGKPSFQVLFGEGLPMQREPIVPTLLRFRDEVNRVISGIEAIFP